MCHYFWNQSPPSLLFHILWYLCIWTSSYIQYGAQLNKQICIYRFIKTNVDFYRNMKSDSSLVWTLLQITHLLPGYGKPCRTAGFIYFNRAFHQLFELGDPASCWYSQLMYFNSFRSRNEKPNLIYTSSSWRKKYIIMYWIRFSVLELFQPWTA